MESLEWISNSPDETFNFAKRLGQLLKAKDIILLEGDLGAGKTTFTKGIAAGLEVQRNVNSPTFTIIKEYQGRLPLYHMDVYRVENEFEDLGFDEYFDAEGVTVIEWAHLISEQLPDDTFTIFLYHEGEDMRKIKMVPAGNRYKALCKELFNENISD